MKTVQDVRQEILDELKIDISTETIRRDQDVGLFEVRRDKENNYRVYSDEDVRVIKYIALLKDVGVPREKIKEVLEGDHELVWKRINQLSNITIPNLRAYL